MVKRLNKIIKDNTIKLHQYESSEQMKTNLDRFFITYNTIKRHSGLRKELNVKTPIKVVYKWFEFEPEIFNEKQIDFENKILNLKIISQGFKQQPC